MSPIKVIFLGRKPVAAKALAWLINNVAVDVVGVVTDSHLPNSECSELAAANQIPVFEFDDLSQRVNSGELEFDLGISMLFWRKLKGGFVHSPRLKTINFHPAPLPEYKGTAGYNLAILEGLNNWGMTAHYVDDEIDTGEIIEVKRFPICPNSETAVSLERESQKHLYDLFVSVLDKVIKYRGVLATTPNEGGRYVSRAEMEAMKEIQEGDDIPRKIRAFWFPPYDGAYVVINGAKYTLVDSTILNGLSGSGVSRVF